MKFLISFSFLLIFLTATAQENNVFLDRGFWKSNPTVQTVKQKIAEGNNPTVFNNNGFDATTLALIANAEPAVIKHLLTIKGNAVDKRTHDSRIYLHWAAYAGNVENVKTLLDLGSDIEAKDSRGNTPLTFAAGAGLTNPDIYNLFNEKGIKLGKVKNPQGATVLMLASPFMKDIDEAKYFLEQGLTLKDVDDEGNNIFNYATRRGNIEFLQSLIDLGVEYKSLNKEGSNAFMFAAQGTRGFQNSVKIYQYLHSLGLDSNVTDKDGQTPLHKIAMRKTETSIVQFLLENKGDVDANDVEGNTPFLNASAKNDLEVIKLMAARSNNPAAVNNLGQSALMFAVAHNNAEVVAYLLEKGLSANAKDNAGNTLAYYLLQAYNKKDLNDFERKLTFLTSNGLMMTEVQGEGNTLYHLAAKEDNVDLAMRLAEFNLPLNDKNEEGMTPLQIAALKAKDTGLLKYLVSKGADKTIETEFGETAYELAVENEMLQKSKADINFLK